MPATDVAHVLPVVVILPQSRLIGIIGSWLRQTRCKISCSLLEFILWILVGEEERFRTTYIWGEKEGGWLLRV